MFPRGAEEGFLFSRYGANNNDVTSQDGGSRDSGVVFGIGAVMYNLEVFFGNFIHKKYRNGNHNYLFQKF